MGDLIEACGGCGQTDPSKACIGCLHFSRAAVTPERGEGLKPCPLCGGQARLGLTNRVERKGAMKDTMSAFCVDCSCMLSRTGPPNSEATKRQVAEAWNTRPAPSPATDEAVEVLREMLAGLDAYMLSGDALSVGLKKQSLGMMPDRARSLLAKLEVRG